MLPWTEIIFMAEKRKYELSVYSRGYFKVLFQAWAWAYSKSQAGKIIRDRLEKKRDQYNLSILDNQDLPYHIVDITEKDTRERATREKVKINSDPATRKRYDACPKCGWDTEYDYCDNCGWQRFSSVSGKKAYGDKVLNNVTDNNEEELI
jgi:hypothetical protein